MRAGVAVAIALTLAALWPLPTAAQVKKGDRDICKTATGTERVEACTRVLNDATISRDDREWFLNERGLAYFNVEDWDRAIADFTESIKINPKDAVVYTNRSDAYRSKNDFALALADANQAIKLDPKSARAYNTRGRAYFYNSDYDRAIPDFSQAIKLDAKFDAAYHYRGTSYSRKAEYKRAIPDLNQAVRLDPNYAPSYFYRGLSYERLDDRTKALENYNKAIALDADHGAARHNRGMIKLEKGDYDGAIEDFSAAIRTTPDEISHNSRGVAYRNKGEFSLAMADFSKAIDFDPKYGRPYYHRGMLHSRNGHAEAALADLRKAVELDPKSREARDALSQALTVAAAAPKPPANASPAIASPSPERLPAGTMPTGKRVALVIGNGKYQHSSRLPNPGNDAADVAGALRGLGFEVVEGRDLDRRGMDDAIRQFARQLNGAGLAILFYSGHGLQVNGKNFLLPVDGKIEKVADLSLDAVDVQRIIEQMEAEKRVNLIFLDACRDNPLTRSLARSLVGATRSATIAEGLAPVQSAAGTLIAYATQPDNVALDGDGRNSPFTTALLKYMTTPGLEIEMMMKQVRLDVIAATKEKQVPWGHSSLVGNVYLKLQ